MKNSRVLAVIVCVMAILLSTVSQGAYLVGAQVYSSGPDGSNTDPYRGGAYQFSTNSSTSHLPLLVNGAGSGIAFALNEGDNSFTFDVTSTAFPINIVGLNLFFNESGASFNPSYVYGSGIPGDLCVYTFVNDNRFFVPAAGTSIQSYDTDGWSLNGAFYNGASTFRIGDELIAVKSFTAVATPSGSFVLNVSTVPEPATLLLLGLGAVMLRKMK